MAKINWIIPQSWLRPRCQIIYILNLTEYKTMYYLHFTKQCIIIRIHLICYSVELTVVIHVRDIRRTNERHVLDDVQQQRQHRQLVVHLLPPGGDDVQSARVVHVVDEADG